MAILLTSLLFVFEISFLPKYRLNYYYYIVLAGYRLRFAREGEGGRDGEGGREGERQGRGGRGGRDGGREGGTEGGV